MFQKGVPKFTLCCLLLIHIQGSGYAGLSQDQTSSRTNTLFDDADDIQRQLDNEARDRIKFGRPKTIWVFHFPTHFPDHNLEEHMKRCPLNESGVQKRTVEIDDEYIDVMTTPLPPYLEWDYNNQAKWPSIFPECGGKSQSPVDLPISGLIKARGARTLLFQNYGVVAKTLTLMNDGKRGYYGYGNRITCLSQKIYTYGYTVILFGEWQSQQRPLIYGGAAHSRRYLFHSLTLHLPSEHTVGGLQFPLESQVLYVSAEYKDMEQALDASPSDPQAFLAVASLYKYSNRTHKGIGELLQSAKKMGIRNGTLSGKPLSYFNPPFKEYACYQGSMTAPPCTESVLWLIRGRTLSIMRETVEAAQALLTTEPQRVFFRSAQALNDRKVYLFK